MANNHGYVSAARTMSENVGALNKTGIYAAADVDNGVLVTISKMVVDSNGNAKGFEYDVALAENADNDDLYIVDTPVVGSNIEMQGHSDPRYFYNAKGRPMTIKKLIVNVDELEVEANCFNDGILPDVTTKKYVKPAVGGKMEATQTKAGSCFEIEALHHTAIGMNDVNTAIIKYVGKQS